MATKPDDLTNPVSMGVYVAFVLAASVIVYSFVTVAREGETRRRCSALCMLRPEYAGASRKAPDFKLKDYEGKDVTLSSYAGKVVVMNFWMQSCQPCLQEMPELGTLASIVKDRSDVAVVSVSIDDGPEQVKNTLKTIFKTEKPPFPVLFDPGGDAIVYGKYGTNKFPETWIIDKHGVIRARFDGAKEWSGSAVIELVDQLRNDGYCPVEINDGRTTGEAARMCEDPAGSGG